MADDPLSGAIGSYQVAFFKRELAHIIDFTLVRCCLNCNDPCSHEPAFSRWRALAAVDEMDLGFRRRSQEYFVDVQQNLET